MPPLNPDAVKTMRRWRADSLSFVRDNFKVEPDQWQIKALRDFDEGKRVALKACKGPGKTAVLAWLGWAFLSTRHDPKIIATSISASNLHDGLWAEFAKWRNRSPFLQAAFDWTKTRLSSKEHPETWFASARSWSQSADKEQQANTLAGIHADNVLFLIDEVGGIPDAVLAAAEGGLSTGLDTKIVIAGNPTHLSGPLYRACTTEAHLWRVTEITGDPDDPSRSPRIDPAWARAQIDTWGRDNPWVLVNVFGKFPPASLNQLIGREEVNEASRRHLRTDQYDRAPKILGVDVARFGDDMSVIFPRQGLAAFQPVAMRNARTHTIADRVKAAWDKWEADGCFVDDTGGFGAGVIDALIQSNYYPVPVHFSQAATQAERYINIRCEMYFELVQWIRRGGVVPPLDALAEELSAHTYFFARDKFQITEKDLIKAVLGRSPDYSDALALTFAGPVRAGEHREKQGINITVIKKEYDPYAEA